VIGIAGRAKQNNDLIGRDRFPLKSLSLTGIPKAMSEKIKDPTEADASFETAMERLDGIVEQMEANKLPLEELLRGYEEGLKLVKFCTEKLDSAEKRIEIITRDAMGKPQVTEFDPVEKAQSAVSDPGKGVKKPTAPSRSDDISLF
jgi:exodeoxyribonuclease VII small subunit